MGGVLDGVGWEQGPGCWSRLAGLVQGEQGRGGWEGGAQQQREPAVRAMLEVLGGVGAKRVGVRAACKP